MDLLDADALRRLYPEAFWAPFLAEGMRPDGRPIGQARGVSIGLGTVTNADASALVKLGDTAMVAAIKVEVMAPSEDRPTAGALLVSCDLPPICSAAVRPGRPPDMAHTISHHLTSLLSSAACVDLTHLCIVPGKAAWAIWLDIVCIDADGALFDAALLAALAALSSLTLPAVDVVANGKVFLHSQQGAQADGGRTGSEGEGGGGGRGDGEGVSTEEGRRDRGGGEGEEAGVEGGKGAERDGDGLVVEQTVEGRRLELQALPLAQTVCLYGGHLLVDPTAEEERLGSGSNNVIIAMDMMAREEGSGAGKGAEEEGEKGGGGKGKRKGVGKGGGVGDGGEELLLVFKAGGSTRLTAAGMQDCIAAAAVNLRERRTALLDALAEAEKGEEEEEEDDVEEGEEGEEMEN
ncbi:unnamed protein product [Closterium sp. NIES-64]|nr:unnamed protein product [Closterium sp. NIES-65]CAI5990474.1 unnamed protein product [Closterium sp. NIES-64]